MLVIVVNLSACSQSSEPTPAITYVPIDSAQVESAGSVIQPVLAPPLVLQVDGSEEETEINPTITRGSHQAEDSFEDNQPLAARVNYQPIFLATYRREVARFEQTLMVQGIDLNNEAGREVLLEVQRQVLEALIDQAIIEQQAAKLNLVITEDAVVAKVQQSMAQAHGQVQFETWLATNGLNYEEFETTLHAQLVATQLFDYLTRNVTGEVEKERTFEDWLMEQRSLAAIERYVAL